MIKPSFALAYSHGMEIGTVMADTVQVDENSTPTPAIIPPTVQDVLQDVCTTRGYGEDCARHLLGMLWKESRNLATAVGDSGNSHGYFQINSYYNPEVSLKCAEDLTCSANWTISYLERNGYQKYPKYAIQCHNGCGFDNGYAASVLYHGQRLWTTPLPINPVVEVAQK